MIMQKKLPFELGKLNNLRTLNVSANKIRLLPPDLGHNQSLEKLDVSSNPLCKVLILFNIIILFINLSI